MDHLTRILIVSEDDPAPWELLHLPAKIQKSSFLVERLPIARWKPNLPLVNSLTMTAACLVSSGGEDEVEQHETTQLRSDFLRRGVQHPQTVDNLPALLHCLDEANFDLLHFACHNSFQPDEAAPMELHLAGQAFQPRFLARHRDRFHQKTPLIFMNACRTDGQTPNFTRTTSWADRFLEAGAGAFIGTLWEVRDESALVFARSFYTALFDGLSLGEAALQARKAILDNAQDPTWLAYVVYGDPAAKISGDAS